MAIKKYQTQVPSAYQEVEYLKSNGTQYIDTDIIPTNSAQTKVQFEFQLTDITNGIYQSIGCNSNMNFVSSQNLLKFRSNGIEIADYDTAWHICEISKSSSGKVTYFDGVKYSTSAATEEAIPFLLFGMSLSADRYYGKYKLKYFKCYENNTLVRNMIPVKRLSDNVLGMYDIANDVFYINQGTGTFEAGADVEKWHTIPYKKYETATDTFTSLPKTIIGDGQPISSYTIKGNMVQSGTPTPSNPIYPQEVGDLVTTGEHAGEYEIPISLSNTPIYLAEPIRKINTYADSVPSTGTANRVVKKLVFDGTEEGWQRSRAYNGSFFCGQSLTGILGTTIEAYCSHAVFTPTVSAQDYTQGKFAIDGTFSAKTFNIYYDNGTVTLADFKQWLADQYTAGTPVTVWYVLATATTESFTAPSIPTSGTAEQFGVDTTLAPSEVSLTYHGWHDHEDTKYTSP